MDSQVRHSAAGTWCVLGAAMLWGTTGTAQAFSPAGFDPKVIGALRLLIGGGALLLIAFYRREFYAITRSNYKMFCFSALFVASYQVCFFSAVERTGVAVGTIVGIGTAPVMGGLLGWFFRGEHLGKRWVAATLTALLGCCLISLNSGAIRIDGAGIALAVSAGISYAAYTLTVKELLSTPGSPLAVMAVVTCAAAVLTAPALLNCDVQWLLQPRSLAVVLHLGLASMALAYALFVHGLKKVPVSTTVTLSLAEPMTAALLGIVVLGENLNSQALTGTSLVFLGLVFLTLPCSKALRKAA